MINGYPVYYDIGLYVFSKKDGKFIADNYERAFNLPQWIILDAYKAFIEKGSTGQSLIAQGSSRREPDYKGFLDWILYFADKVDCDFFIKADDGHILTGVDALKYSLEKKKFGFTGKYLEDSVCKIENGKITSNTAFSIINNNAMFVEPNEQRVSPVWLARNDDGIWFFMEEAVTYKDAAGKTQWKNGWYNPVLVEDNEGNSVLARYNPLGKKIKATDDDTIATIKINSGKLIYKNYEDDKYFLYADSENIECKSLVDAVAKAKKFVEEKVGQQELVELVISNSAEDSVTQTETELKMNDELDVQTDNLSPQTESSNLDLVVLDKPNVTSDSVPPTESSQNKNQLFIIIFFVVIFLCIVELAIIFIILSKKFNQHLSKKDKKFIFKIQEDERSKLSRDIHDSVVQNIRAIRLDTEMLNVVPESETKKQRVIEEMTNVISLLRNICYNFRPAELSVQTENTELISIIDTLCQQFIARTKIPCHIQIQKDFVPPKMDTEKSTNIVRVIQEALANIEKHSYATNVQVVIQSEGEDTKTLVIFIIDDGIGCEVSKLGKSKMNFGIRNMRDRIAAAGGEIEFFSVPDEGLSVQLRIPY
jgi:signal transduction histidine kinase